MAASTIIHFANFTIMKIRINILGILATVVMLGFLSCNKEGVLVTASPSTQVELTASQQTIVLTEANAAEKAVDLTWNKADFSYAAAINATLQLSFKDSAFRKFSSVGVGAATTASLTVADLNTLLLGAKYPAGQVSDVMIRVLSKVTDSLYVFSDTVTLHITPYMAKRVISYPVLYVPGDYQGWAPGSETIGRLFSTADNGAYEGYVNFPADTNYFKFTPVADWKNEYGASGVGKLTQKAGSDNVELDTSGYCLLKVDTKKLTWTATVENWGMIGDAAKGWGDADDIMFDFDSQNQVLVKTVNLKVGPLKFRANHKWELNIGAGTKYGGDNIDITEAGTYKITLDLRVPSEPILTMVIQ